jgi:hypothetical protein
VRSLLCCGVPCVVVTSELGFSVCSLAPTFKAHTRLLRSMHNEAVRLLDGSVPRHAYRLLASLYGSSWIQLSSVLLDAECQHGHCSSLCSETGSSCAICRTRLKASQPNVPIRGPVHTASKVDCQDVGNCSGGSIVSYDVTLLNADCVRVNAASRRGGHPTRG